MLLYRTLLWIVSHEKLIVLLTDIIRCETTDIHKADSRAKAEDTDKTMAPAPARVSLKKFLLTARKALLAPPAQRPNPLIFVVGNESAGRY